MPAVESRLSRLWAHEKASYGLRVFIALTTVLAVCWQQQMLQAIPGLFLGIIASAIAETDDNVWGRSKSVLLSLLCFAGAAAAVIALFPHPLPFAAALALAAFALTLLGALGERYASIAQATVTLAIYTMIALDQLGGGGPSLAWREAAHLLIGAAWYGLLSILWTALFANRPVRERLARLFVELGRYLRLKAALFEPVREDTLQARRLALAEQNARVVAALNAAKGAILARFGRSGRPGVQSGLYFRLYYMAQDFHERASSSHYPYEALTEAFFHSDVLYRCHRVLEMQGKACARLGEAIRLRQPFVYGEHTRQAMADLDASLAFLHTQHTPGWRRLLGSLELLCSNLRTIERQLSEASLADSTLDNIDTRLRDSTPHTLGEMALRLRQQLTPGSVLFRHGLRVAIALVCGYALTHLLDVRNGYWILLTTVFVCRPHYGATRLRLVQRMAGTVVGLVATWALMQLFPGTEAQLLLALLAALLFFVTRSDRYLLATAAITVMALVCFNLLGDGFVLIWPRLLDTLIGCLIAAAASFLILPDWQGRRLHLVMANVVASCARYLQEVLGQYHSGMRDDLPYRVARRDMHNADAALSAALGNMLREPGYLRRNLDAGFRFLALSNTLLGYLSALGAHRVRLDGYGDDALIGQGGEHLRQALERIAAALSARQPLPAADESADAALAQALEQMPDELDGRLRLIRTQLALMLQLLPRLREAANAASAPQPPAPAAAAPALPG
ncbi:YccS family putative transporter [Flavobacterium sp. MXW15]|uniref:YccS family putative transporter n=1 Tax=Xanthomonas chitinilytica TaxID=2989819 RepID=A0ABT3JWS1_9XANT|nr:YccS family putative transporter [Xanthomonas sp. H13-6]MCW4455722.1 YccS family putative transporter [Flavobacterium sp. MXW15]MCW4472938.1 YccS family putative transporter [Xanthomonas sp. H13-6]